MSVIESQARGAPPALLTDHLLPHESLLWWDQPGQGLVLTPRDGFLIPFSLLWGGFAIYWEASVLRTDAPTFMALWGVPFILIGLFLIFGRFLLDAWLRARTHYGLTDRRILIARTGPWPSFKAINLDHLPEATLNKGASGRGTIRFGPPAGMWGNTGSNSAGFGSWVAALDPTPQFLAIDDATRVFTAVQEQIQTLRA